MYPEDLVEQFHSLQGRYVYDSSGEAQLGTLEPAPVKTYRSTLTSVRSNIRYQMNKFLARRAQDPDSCVWETGHKEWAIYGADPIYSISDNTILLVLTGKGTVKEIRGRIKDSEPDARGAQAEQIAEL